MLRTHIPGFDQEKYAFEIAWMLWQTTVPSRQHRHYLGGVWFTTKEIRELLGEVKRFYEVDRYRPHENFYRDLKRQERAAAGIL
jgi:hypothetical protein